MPPWETRKMSMVEQGMGGGAGAPVDLAESQKFDRGSAPINDTPTILPNNCMCIYIPCFQMLVPMR